MQNRLLPVIPALLLLLFVDMVPLCVFAAPALRFGLALEGLPDSAAVIVFSEDEVGLPVSLVNVFLQWPAEPDAGEFPLKAARAVSEHGAILVLTWEPMFLTNGKETAILAEDIISGRWDGYIERFARAAAAWGGTCILRFGHEMNLARYHWGSPAAEYGPASPPRYRLMFRHVVTQVRKAGAVNIQFAFCPNIESSPSLSPHAAWNTASAYYPGNAYVDVLGMDGYNWGTTQTLAAHGWESRWQSFETLFSPLFTELRTLAPAKPIYIFETASTSQGGNKARWISDMVSTAKKWQVAGLVWFQVNKELDWKLQAEFLDDTVISTFARTKDPL